MTWAKVTSLVCRNWSLSWTTGLNTQSKWKLRYSPIKCAYLEPLTTYFSNRSTLNSTRCYKGVKITRLLSFSNQIPFYFYLGRSYLSDRYSVVEKDHSLSLQWMQSCFPLRIWTTPKSVNHRPCHNPFKVSEKATNHTRYTELGANHKAKGHPKHKANCETVATKMHNWKHSLHTCLVEFLLLLVPEKEISEGWKSYGKPLS